MGAHKMDAVDRLKKKIEDRLEDCARGEWDQLFNELLDESNDPEETEVNMHWVGQLMTEEDTVVGEFCRRFA